MLGRMKNNVETDLKIDIDESVSAADPVSETLIGVVDNCKLLNIRKEPSKQAEVVCVVEPETVLMIDVDESTAGWHKVYTEAGVEGFCMKEFVKITE